VVCVRAIQCAVELGLLGLTSNGLCNQGGNPANQLCNQSVAVEGFLLKRSSIMRLDLRETARRVRPSLVALQRTEKTHLARLHPCMCKCTYVYIYIHIYIYMYIYVYTYTCICIYTPTLPHTCIDKKICLYVCTCLCVRVCVCMCLCVCVWQTDASCTRILRTWQGASRTCMLVRGCGREGVCVGPRERETERQRGRRRIWILQTRPRAQHHARIRLSVCV